MSWTTCLIVMLGGALGTLARYAMSVTMAPISRAFPWSTLSINIIGSFIIALFGTLTLVHGRLVTSENTRLFVMVGLCGGFTTFSSFSLQTLDLARIGSPGRAAWNIALSVVLCLAAAALGAAIGRHYAPGAIQLAALDPDEEA
ncbi:integral membrane protein CrcB [Ameyamaea chiangmaiensis NBRC 103196]|uniref:Fluoride-specific ion channel FluC n=1 Tax=Ameyamaea chiangmaiensis TaxID=442969 RepID=A0A850PGP1_9PROT|nr:fluoride efflux transporter CrcB [Ameyamaea chiangmaiensis]MBS4075773.1 fluoride efflux transporter CrcB [Ameyamaea chiangmaiensis]NVN41590.1 fluoride efflux transporter CrcB [Ameyamaea chiangmaiensis]GBQ63699.1 integral membrane protein CrcB [Ameyamaea chiangmaiensis NBRC 103196]